MMTILREYRLSPHKQLHSIEVPASSDFQYITTNPERNLVIVPVMESGHPENRVNSKEVEIVLLQRDHSFFKDPHRVYRSLGSVNVKDWQNDLLEARVYALLVLPI